MKTEFHKSFEKDVRAIQDRKIRERIKVLIETVERIDELDEITNLKKLSGGAGYYRIRVGDYRVGITLSKATVTFVRVLHRKEIYRYFP